MDKQLSPLVLGFLFVLTGACGGDSKPGTKPVDEPVGQDDDSDQGEPDIDGGRRDAGGGSSNGNRDSGGGSNNNNNRDSGGGSNGGRDARVDNGNGNRDSGGPAPTPDGGGGGPDVTPVACDTSKAPTIPPLALQPVVSGVEGLTYATQAPGGSEWYLLQQSGQIRVFKDGKLETTPFLNVSSEISLSSSAIADDERGLLGLAFPPDYATTGKFYIMLTPTSGAGMNRDTVREYKRSAANPLVADAMATRTIVQLESSDFNHNGGNIAFGPDGMLYVGTGDGGGRCGSSKRGAGQDVNSLFGKILRLDVNAAEPFAASGNPFASGGDARVFHYGLRNPYRFAFDRATGDLYIGDVGQDAFEELSFAAKDEKGVNFGWPTFEGKTMSTGQGSTCSASALRSGSMHTAPLYDFDRRTSSSSEYRDWRSIIGGRVYRGSALPGLRGTYIFGDYKGVRMAALVRCEGKTSPMVAILKNADANQPNAPSFSRPSGSPAFAQLTAIVEGNDGELYMVANFDRLLKVVPRQ